ncbi:hypothetical protein HYN56_12665 [Flavobacterium crocinum]|uniref:Uncharacterized protein n=1 Tax=Flavobacterium crocinum TaxID=2183896 RepID=A0A2S1YLS4_9FLAO|nr:hypothetical protein HYN56_12665 [Flavobacterium crocinum]
MFPLLIAIGTADYKVFFLSTNYHNICHSDEGGISARNSTKIGRVVSRRFSEFGGYTLCVPVVETTGYVFNQYAFILFCHLDEGKITLETPQRLAVFSKKKPNASSA